MEMSQDEIERERRTGRIAGVLGLTGVISFFAVGLIGLAGDFQSADGLAESLEAFPAERSEVLALLAVQSLGIALFIAPMLALFSAVRRRNEAFRPGLVGLCIAGPLFFAASLIGSFFALDAAVDAFDLSAVPEGDDPDDAAEDVYLDQSAASVTSGLRFAGQLGLVFVMIYTSLNAMRAGLLTRFWGTLGMALGVGVILVGPPAFLAFFLAISLMVARFWPGGLPPAWDAGRAIPWPKPGQEVVEEPSAEEPARPEDFEGSATELDSERPGRRDNKRKRKRKQRG